MSAAPDALVVYESMFGNTRVIAEAVAAGLRGRGFRVAAGNVVEISPRQAASCPLLVLGGPRQAFSLSVPATRAGAIRSCAPLRAGGLGMRQWLGLLPPARLGQVVVTFDTRVDGLLGRVGSAASAAGRLARTRGFRTDGGESFVVLGKQGPLRAGELARATQWGAALASTPAVSLAGRVDA